MRVTFAELIAWRRYHNTPLWVEEHNTVYTVETDLPSGRSLETDVVKGSADDTTLQSMAAWWNKPIGGDILDLVSVNFADSPYAGDWAFTVEAGKKLQVVRFRGLISAEAVIPAGNELHVSLVLSADGSTAVPAWTGTRTAPSEPGWVLLSNNTLENAQEYRRWYDPTTQTAVIEFIYGNLLDVSSKGHTESFERADGSILHSTDVDYLSRGANLQLRSSLNERIEVWAANSQPYQGAVPNPVEAVRVAMLFNRFPEF